MPKFKVILQQTIHEQAETVIEAETAEQASELAMLGYANPQHEDDEPLDWKYLEGSEDDRHAFHVEPVNPPKVVIIDDGTAKTALAMAMLATKGLVKKL